MLHAVLETLTLLLVLGQVAPASTPKPIAPSTQPVIEKVPTAELTIEQGKIRGLVIGENKDVLAYRGIPYAASPAGERRWKAPEPAEKWTGVRDCFAFGPACPQKYSPMMGAVPMAAIKSFSEDCLNLNIYRPAKAANEKLPVMVWIHGGGYTEGSASQGIYDGEVLARKGVVVVTINYRLGPFGFLAHPALSAESKQNVSGNYGILDQIEALRWVKKNITAFGGDPDRVTIFGESAGGGSVVCLMVAPEAKGLFHRAIAQSTPEMSLRHLKEKSLGRKSEEEQGTEVIAQCGLGKDADASAMRQIPADRLVKEFPTLKVMGQKVTLGAAQLPSGPVVDGVVIPEDPNLALAAGRFHHVPFIIGTTRDEAALFLMVVKLPTEKEEYQSLITDEFGAMAANILSAYPPAQEAKVIRLTAVQLLTDLVYGTQARFAALKSAAAGQKTYKYVFSREVKLMNINAAFHGCDVPYVFGVQPLLLADYDKTLSDMTQQYWANFAKTGNPNGAGLPAWPAYDAKSEETLELGDKVAVVAKYRKAPLDVMDKFLKERAK